MSNNTSTNSRRRFIKLAAIGLAATPVGHLLLKRTAGAQDKTKLDENDPQAKALGYVHDATKVDVKNFPKRAGEEGAKQFCDNCQLYTGVEGEEWGPCAIFHPDLVVNAKGWCNSWVAKAI